MTTELNAATITAPTKRFLTIAEFAAYIGVSRSTANKLAAKGEIPLAWFGSVRKVDMVLLDEQIRARHEQGPPQSRRRGR